MDATSFCRSTEARRASATETASRASSRRACETTRRSNSSSWRFEIPLRPVHRGLRLGDLRLDDGDLRRALALLEVFELRFGARQLRGGLGGGGLRLGVVDAEEQRALLDLVAAPDGKLDDAAADLRRDLDEVAFDIALEARGAVFGAAGGEEEDGEKGERRVS